jgi:hypothetical protein
VPEAGRGSDNVSTVGTSDAAGDGETDPSAGRAAGSGAAIEAFENSFEILRGDSLSGVDDVHPCSPTLSSRPDGDSASGWGVGEGVAEEVGEDLAETVPVDSDRQ